MKIKMLYLVVVIFGLFGSCKESVKNTEPLVKLITAEEMDSLLKMEKVQLVDVRTPKEYEAGHIPNAININFYDENFEKLISTVDKSKPVAVYCGRGGRSAKCSEYMKKAGFTKIYDLDGGITEWKFKGKSIVK